MSVVVNLRDVRERRAADVEKYIERLERQSLIYRLLARVFRFMKRKGTDASEFAATLRYIANELTNTEDDDP